MRFSGFRLLAVVASLLAPSVASAAPITLQFNGLGGFVFGSSDQGVNIAGIHGGTNFGGIYGRALRFGFDAGYYNVLTFSMGGNAFNLSSMDFLLNNQDINIVGSNGTNFAVAATSPPTFNFGSMFLGITSFQIFSGSQSVIDNVTFNAPVQATVPAPGALALLGLGLLGIAGLRRRKAA
jgi:hypothetical protein